MESPSTITIQNGDILSAEVTLTLEDGSRHHITLHDVAPGAGFIYREGGEFVFRGHCRGISDDMAGGETGGENR